MALSERGKKIKEVRQNHFFQNALSRHQVHDQLRLHFATLVSHSFFQTVRLPSEEKAPEASSDATMENAQIQEADEAETSRKEEEKAGWSELTDGQILEEAVIRIQKAETAGGEVLYQAAVEQADADKILESGMQIALVCDDDTEYDFLRGPRDEKELKEEEMYRVTLRYDVEGGRFVVLEAENWEA